MGFWGLGAIKKRRGLPLNYLLQEGYRMMVALICHELLWEDVWSGSGKVEGGFNIQ